jgi:hypothetical protein
VEEGDCANHHGDRRACAGEPRGALRGQGQQQREQRADRGDDEPVTIEAADDG